MDIDTNSLPIILWVLVIITIWFIIRKILKSLSDRINNAELYKEDMLSVLEEIRDELKELNKNNSVK
jgi:flagellar biosynthesis/type III secretory pathway M-ring protein FliF/YscJ